jgi:hypothetical protein
VCWTCTFGNVGCWTQKKRGEDEKKMSQEGLMKGVEWVLHRADFYSPVSFVQSSKFSDVSDWQSPIDGVKAVMTMSV